MSQLCKTESEPQENCLNQHQPKREIPGLKKKDGPDSFVNTYFTLLSISPKIANEMTNEILHIIAEFVTSPNCDKCSKLTLQSDVFECPECHDVYCDSGESRDKWGFIDHNSCGLFCDICMKMFCQQCVREQCEKCNDNICIVCICKNRAKMCEWCGEDTVYCGKCVKSSNGVECISCSKFFCGDCAEEDFYSDWNDEYVCEDCAEIDDYDDIY